MRRPSPMVARKAHKSDSYFKGAHNITRAYVERFLHRARKELSMVEEVIDTTSLIILLMIALVLGVCANIALIISTNRSGRVSNGERVDGGWSPWSSITTCPEVCHSAQGAETTITHSMETRTCTNPPPKNGGRQCEGGSFRTAPCNCHVGVAFSERVNGGWSDWVSMIGCDEACRAGGAQFEVWHRFCDNPAPSFGGSYCEGSSVKSVSCNCSESDTRPFYQPFGLAFRFELDNSDETNQGKRDQLRVHIRTKLTPGSNTTYVFFVDDEQGAGQRFYGTSGGSSLAYTRRADNDRFDYQPAAYVGEDDFVYLKFRLHPKKDKFVFKVYHFGYGDEQPQSNSPAADCCPRGSNGYDVTIRLGETMCDME